MQEVLGEGDRVSAVVIDINGTANRISLSTKVLEVEPGDMMQDKVGSLMFRSKVITILDLVLDAVNLPELHQGLDQVWLVSHVYQLHRCSSPPKALTSAIAS